MNYVAVSLDRFGCTYVIPESFVERIGEFVGTGCRFRLYEASRLVVDGKGKIIKMREAVTAQDVEALFKRQRVGIA